MEFVRKGRRLINQFLGRDLFYAVQIDCKREFLGTSYGGYYVCPDGITKDSILYSFGVGDDISFDLAIIQRFGAKVFAFDPTPKSISWIKGQKLPKEFHFHEYGIAGYDGIADFHPPKNPKHISYTMTDKPTSIDNVVKAEVHRLKTIMKMLGHEKVDILKMDIEGAEYDVINDLITSNVEVHQLLMEFHHRFKYVGISKTKRAIALLEKKRFKIFYISPSGEVYSFIKI
jgi:FkbM family methyltransferase